MARGFFSRAFSAIRRIFAPSEPTPPPAPPPAPPPEPPERPSRNIDRDMRDAWREEMLQRRPGRSYRRHAELFNSIPDIDLETPEERDYLWRSYIENMVKGRHRRNDPNNPWWSDINMMPENFDWEEFRRAIDSPGK